MQDPLIPIKKVKNFFRTLGISIDKTRKEWVVKYKGKPIRTIAIKHGGESGIKLPYVYHALKEKLKSDGLKEGTPEFEENLKTLKKAV